MVTVIAIAGVAAGVMALIVALAVNNGFRNTLQRNLLGATAHVNVLSKDPGVGISEWRPLVARMRPIPHVTAVAPVLYGEVFMTGPRGTKGSILKGIDLRSELATSDMLRHLKSGSLARLIDDTDGLPGLILGASLAQDAGLILNSVVSVTSPQGQLTPFGPGPKSRRYRVVGIFESGVYQIDEVFAYAPMASVQKLLGVGDEVNSIEMRVDNLDLARAAGEQAARLAGPRYSVTNWEEQNKELLHALNMERAVTFITIGLIELVGGLNILITLTMIVLTKYRDIGVLLSMGARRGQVRRIFIAQGAAIGAAGTAIGLAAGYAICYFADKYHLVRLDETVYALSFVPFEPRAWDGVWIAAAAMAWSLIATLYPARNATRVSPVEVLRYE